jgi:hypothetical protein
MVICGPRAGNICGTGPSADLVDEICCDHSKQNSTAKLPNSVSKGMATTAALVI